MASFKALCLAGVASLAVTAAAHAADLLPPAPAPVEQPVYAPPAAPIIGGGWYLRGDVGVGIANLDRRDSDFSKKIPGIRYDQTSLDDSGFVDAGVGYRVNEWFRADITGEYRAAAHFSGIESYSTAGGCVGPCTSPRGYDKYDGSIQSTVGLINGYVNLGTYLGFSPFIGGGVGLARIGAKDFTDIGTVTAGGGPGGFGYSKQDNYQTNFAFAVMAGLDFAVTQNLTMEIGYRYLDMGKVRSGTIVCINQQNCRENNNFRLASNDIRVGFRYTFADALPLAAPSFPLVRKY